MKKNTKAIIMVVAATFIAALGQFFQKRGADTLGSTFLEVILNPNIILGIVFYVLCGALYILALRHGDLSVLFPLMALNLVWVAVISSIIFSEQMSWNSWLGTGLILAGAVFLGRGAK